VGGYDHLHAHCLITFGGIKNNKWVWPKRKKKIARYRQMCWKFREIFIRGLDKEINTGSIDVPDYEEIREELSKRRWNVRNSYPTLQTGLIENYLARYINRVAISKNRLKYLESEKQVLIVYNDYRNQLKDQVAPKAIKKLSPLVALHQIIRHLLPPYFQKSRHYGLHSTAIFSKVKGDMPQLLRNVGQTIRTVFQILKDLLKLNPLVCEKCHQPNLARIPILSDCSYIKLIVTVPKGRPPPLGNKIKSYRS
jgi:hypothetical protein